jgi:pimeloyl-ACP methyl ester carboxylesterase
MKLLATLLLALVAAPAPAAPQRQASGLAAVMDPPRDAAHPARNQQLVIPSGPARPELGRAAEMNGLFFLAAGAGPHATMILLHGLPGNERNLDLAQAVRRAGWNVLTFTDRGAWGSEGAFSILHANEDAAASLAFLRRPDVAARYGVDTRRIVIAGHSMGGYAAAATAAEAPADIAGLILIDAWDIGRDADAVKAGGARGHSACVAGLDDLGHAIGAITADDVCDELARRGGQWHLAPLAPALARMPILTVYATHGGAAPNRAFAETLRRAGAHPTAREMDTDHSFADHRIALATEVVRWLQVLPGR